MGLEKSNRIVSLMYHDVYEHSPSESGFTSVGANYYKITKSKFETQISALNRMCVDNQLKRENILLTFDDGGSTSQTIIAPILEKYNFKGYFFIATNYINKEGFLTENMIKQLYKRGHIIGAHSCSHPSNITELSYEKRYSEWKDSIRYLCSIVGNTVNCISIPNGYYKPADIEIFQAANIHVVFSSTPIMNKSYGALQLLGRMAISSATTDEIFKKMIEDPMYSYYLQFRYIFFNITKRILGRYYGIIKTYIRKI